MKGDKVANQQAVRQFTVGGLVTVAASHSKSSNKVSFHLPAGRL